MRRVPRKPPCNTGFTLIELSIVLVIIGLIVGGVLVGQDLIRAAAVRAQISQIEKYQSAVNTFRGKYGYLPGDIPDPDATRFGFAPRGTQPGQGDGNGVLAGSWGGVADGYATLDGENSAFWVDLSQANLIDGNFSVGVPTANPGLIGVADMPQYFPAAKIGQSNLIAVFSGGYKKQKEYELGDTAAMGDSLNYFSIGAFTDNGSGGGVPFMLGETTMTPQQAYGIDKKMDDGLPQTGSVTALNVGGYDVIWAEANHFGGDRDPTTGGPVVAGDGVATPASGTTCYDNGNVAGATEQYSILYQGGNSATCTSTFRFQ